MTPLHYAHESCLSERARGVVFLAAVFADSIDLKRVSSGEVVVFAADFLLEVADFLGKKLD